MTAIHTNMAVTTAIKAIPFISILADFQLRLYLLPKYHFISVILTTAYGYIWTNFRYGGLRCQPSR